MKVKFNNTVFGESYLSTESSRSSYGMPILVDNKGNEYGREDNIRGDSLAFLLPEINTAGNLIEYELGRGVSRTLEEIEMAKLFLS